MGACAQTTALTGVVAVQNSAYETGTRQYIPDAAVRAAFAKAASSDAQGRFRLQFAGLGAGVPKDDAAALDRLITCARQRGKARFEDPLLVKKDLVHTTHMDLAKRMDRKDVFEEFATY